MCVEKGLCQKGTLLYVKLTKNAAYYPPHNNHLTVVSYDIFSDYIFVLCSCPRCLAKYYDKSTIVEGYS